MFIKWEEQWPKLAKYWSLLKLDDSYMRVYVTVITIFLYVWYFNKEDFLKKRQDHNPDFEPLGDNSGKHPVFLGFTKIGSLFVPYLSEKSKSEIIKFSFNINSTLNYCLFSFLIICCPHFKATSEGKSKLLTWVDAHPHVMKRGRSWISESVLTKPCHSNPGTTTEKWCNMKLEANSVTCPTVTAIPFLKLLGSY